MIADYGSPQMTVRIDPERNEISLLKQAGSWRGKTVIEIGCGNGRLTRRIASLAAKSIHAIDPNADLIRAARSSLPAGLLERVRYSVGSAERLKYPSDKFDIAVFSWVL